MSPAFQYKNYDYTKKVQSYNGKKKNIKIYIDNGGLELEQKLQPGIDKMLLVLKEKGYKPDTDLLWFFDKTAPHNEIAWAERFWRPLKFLFKK